jgi:Probable cobalt transporter subunit (CbtB)
MTAPAARHPHVALPAVPVPLWAWAMVVVGLAVMFLALHENGAMLASSAHTLHEFFHDGRHSLGVPCH